MIQKLIEVGPKKITEYLYQEIKKQLFFSINVNLKAQETTHPSTFLDKTMLGKIDTDSITIFQKPLSLDEINWQIDADDIKIPWEISRFNYLCKIGEKYHQTGDHKYLKAFENVVSSWIKSHPFKKGVNWKCTMDVSIRAVNMIWGLFFFDAISDEVKKLITNSLYEHFYYIENNWEIFFKNNNHYIADLVGYFYLCFFFDKKDKMKWCHKKLIDEFFMQVQPDGTLYEGSTNYHKLVYEMFIHFKMLCDHNNIQLPSKFNERLEKSKQFLEDCSDGCGNLVQIGDNDSGKFVNGVSVDKKEECIKYYQDFGLSIIKKDNVHITYRHPTYKNHQPSGHFHNDELSITLSINGALVIVDPGTGSYTGNPKLRNTLRSQENHNTFYVKQEQFGSLFSLNRPKQYNTAQMSNDGCTILDYYKRPYKAYRKLDFTNQVLTLTDWWDQDLVSDSHWNFTLHPDIKVNENLEVFHDNKKIAVIRSSLNFSILDGIYSPGYGVTKKTTRLYARANASVKPHETKVHLVD